jgi:hypothetical protein
MNSNSQEFSISRISFIRHVLVLILTILLCFSLFMSELTHFQQNHQIILISKMTPIYVLLIAFSLLMSVKAIVSVKRVKVNSDSIELNNLFWHEKVNWSELKALTVPKNLKFAWLKTKKSFYLFIKPELQNYAELETLIGQHLTIES